MTLYAVLEDQPLLFLDNEKFRRNKDQETLQPNGCTFHKWNKILLHYNPTQSKVFCFFLRKFVTGHLGGTRRVYLDQVLRYDAHITTQCVVRVD